MNGMSGAPSDPRPIKPGHLGGRMFVALKLLGLLLLALGLYFGLKAYLDHARAHRPPDPPLAWSERTLWQPFPLVPYEAERDMLSAAETGMKYRKQLFALDPDPAKEKEIEADLLALAALARDLPAFDGAAGRAQIEETAARRPAQFYPAWLLAVWHARQSDWTAFDAQMARALPLADRVFTEGGHPPRALGTTLAIGFDRIRETPRDGAKRPQRTIEQNLILVYPTPPADERGVVVLPVFKDFYRFANPAIAGPQPGKDWFALPQGRVGGLDHPASLLPDRAGATGPVRH